MSVLSMVSLLTKLLTRNDVIFVLTVVIEVHLRSLAISPLKTKKQCILQNKATVCGV